MDSNALGVALAHSTGVIVVKVRGEIDILAIPRLTAALNCIDATYMAVSTSREWPLWTPAV